MSYLCGEAMCDSEAVAIVYACNGGNITIRKDHLDLKPDHIVDPSSYARCIDHLIGDVEKSLGFTAIGPGRK